MQQATRIDIAKSGGFQKSAAYVNCIAINPVNADEMIVVFSNYSVKSLFATFDGGSTWKDISANLEQFPDGTGNGPSCRWASIMPVGHHFAYFIGTSTGLYSTDTLKGDSTVWTQQSPNGIGNGIVSMTDTRPSDGLLAVGTYGNGIYTANINFAYQISGIKENSEKNDIINSLQYYPNPLSNLNNLMLSFETKSPGEKVTLSVLNEEGKMVQNPLTIQTVSGKQTIPVSIKGLTPGIYYLRLEQGQNEVSRTFVVE